MVQTKGMSMSKVFILLLILILSLPAQEKWQALTYDSSKAPADNPLKGFIPYAGDGLNGEFPFSMEWFYLGLSEVMNGPKSFTFEKSLEVKLNEIASILIE